ncbi:MAG: T9SS type A sorting domain-containing protein, partial [Candidatus Cloacimonetes bacterium]|nr:T9SS type A sorting domain-containing protein [Candidatus Cloacimonadota bacterium]
TPPPNWNGTGSLFMTVDDGLDHPLTVEIELDVVAQNDAPFLDFCNAPIEPVSDPAQFLAELGLRLADVDNDLLSLRWFLDGTLLLEDELQASMDTTECISPSPDLEDLLAPGILHLEVSDGLVTLNQGGVESSWQILSTSVEATLPLEWALDAIHPNPFNPATVLPFSLPREAWMRLSVYNLQGQRVALLHDGTLAAGQHRLTWNASNHASGVYLAVLESADVRLVRKMTLLR